MEARPFRPSSSNLEDSIGKNRKRFAWARYRKFYLIKEGAQFWKISRFADLIRLDSWEWEQFDIIIEMCFSRLTNGKRLMLPLLRIMEVHENTGFCGGRDEFRQKINSPALICNQCAITFYISRLESRYFRLFLKSTVVDGIFYASEDAGEKKFLLRNRIRNVFVKIDLDERPVR